MGPEELENGNVVLKDNASTFLNIENSIYLGSGKRVEQNKQIVINGVVNSQKATEKWSLIKS